MADRTENAGQVAHDNHQAAHHNCWVNLARPSFAVLAAALLLAACTTEVAAGPDQPPPTTPAAFEDDRCPAGGTGTLEVSVTGLPAGITATVQVADAVVTASETLTVAGGEQQVAPAVVVGHDDPLVRQVFGADATVACVPDGQRAAVTVAYEAVATSHQLWVANDVGGSANLLGFAASDLSGSGEVTPASTAATRGKAVLAFDRAGNLWVPGRTIDDPPLIRYPAAAIAAGGGQDRHDVGLSPAVLGDSPTAEALAFDADGNLWVAVQDGPIVMFRADQLTATGSPAPAVEIGGPARTRALAFDARGNLWASHDRAVVRFDAARLATATVDQPDLVLELMSPPPVIGPLPPVWGMAFDADGNLWVNHQGTLMARLTPDDQDQSGRQQLTPQVQINVAVTALAQGIAFDDSGGLWLVYDEGRLARLAPAQLTSSASSGARAVPETVIASDDLGHGGTVAIYPAPAGLPLHHSLP